MSFESLLVVLAIFVVSSVGIYFIVFRRQESGRSDRSVDNEMNILGQLKVRNSASEKYIESKRNDGEVKIENVSASEGSITAEDIIASRSSSETPTSGKILMKDLKAKQDVNLSRLTAFEHNSSPNDEKDVDPIDDE